MRGRDRSQETAALRAQVFMSRAVNRTEIGIARSARTWFLPPHFPSAFTRASGKPATQVPAILAAIVFMTAV
jgi:hypothetical protein